MSLQVANLSTSANLNRGFVSSRRPDRILATAQPAWISTRTYSHLPESGFGLPALEISPYYLLANRKASAGLGRTKSSIINHIELKSCPKIPPVFCLILSLDFAPALRNLTLSYPKTLSASTKVQLLQNERDNIFLTDTELDTLWAENRSKS